jgi:serine phosphatase RsbU (regulator of sigma subunit)
MLREDGALGGRGVQLIDMSELRATEPRLVPAEQHTSDLLQQLQSGLIPRAKIDERWNVAWRYRASDDAMMLGGDFLGILDRPDGSLALMVGDVAGRGASAAGIGSMLRSGWLALVHGGASMEDIPIALDTVLKGQTRGSGVFATACFVEIDRSRSTAKVISAGHDSPLLITPSSASLLVSEHGPALSLGSREGWPLQRVQISTPATVVLYTDGLTESRQDESSPRLGIEGLLASIDRGSLVTQPPQEALDRLLEEALPERIQDLRDDLAVILVALGD